ncbi:MAG: peroxide stress protein YaaA [Solirubrobacteraceae bacterium]|nr:peroxide stress protein YaaA [Solirubrobacteraceae bacterium]
MLTVLSPAKSLDFDSKLPTKKHSQPRLLDGAEVLADQLAAWAPEEIGQLMSISDDLAALNAERFRDFTLPFEPGRERPAVLAFAGDVYVGMQARTFGERDFIEAQKTVRILSGLYGVLRPMDLMAPYRLEMGTRLTTSAGDSLYAYWRDRVTALLAEDLTESPGPPVLLNLASAEYFGVVDTQALGAKVISPRFLDAPQSDPSALKVISFHAKKARGAMASWLVRERIRSPRKLPEFAGLGYAYDAARSTSTEPTFIRTGAAA